MDGGAVLDRMAGGALALGVSESLTGRAWRLRAPAEERLGLHLAQRLNLPEMVGRILAARGVSAEDALSFLQPTLRALLPDPSLLLDMERAADRLAHAVRTAETVAVFGDYDVDGACSAALLTLFLRGLGCAVLPYVPDRLTEGYGPNAPALSGLAARGATLIVCADCGTAAASAFAAMDRPADIIVLDHHKADGPPPPVLATVNPNRLDDTSGLRHLCAAGVAFMAAIATLRALRRSGYFAARPEPDLRLLLDLVALATVCDVMPLTGVNRALVAQGLRIMGQGARPGIAALLEVAQTRGLPSAMTCGFALGPRINAGGRISEADLGLRLLICDDPLEARALAERLDAVNRQRQTVEQGVLDAAISRAEAQLDSGHRIILVSGEAWHPGVVGIVAGRLRERFNRPALVGGHAGELVRGSGRSVPGADLGAAVLAARQAGLLETGGGHAMAAGFAFRAGTHQPFHDFLHDRLDAALGLPSRPHLDVDGVITPRGARLDLAQAMGRLAPFGQGNEEPALILRAVRVARADRLGNDGNTLRIQAEGDGARVKCLLFRAGDGPLAQALTDRAGGLLHLAGTLRAEQWNGTESVSFFIQDAAWA